MDIVARLFPRTFRDTLALVIIAPSMALFALNRDIPEALAVAIGAVVLYYFTRDNQ